MGRVLAAALVGFLFPAVLTAGSWSDLSKVKRGSKLTVDTKDGRGAKGKLVTVSEAAIILDVAEIARAEVRSITRRQRKSLKRSILLGVAIGAGGGAALGAIAGGCGSHDFICFGRRIAVPVSAVAGGAAGAMWGTVLGLSRHRTVVLYESP